MIHISLTRKRIKITDRRKVYTSIPHILPMALIICGIIKLINKEYNLHCTIFIRINNALDLEVRNEY